jgi:hypothetical protein
MSALHQHVHIYADHVDACMYILCEDDRRGHACFIRILIMSKRVKLQVEKYVVPSSSGSGSVQCSAGNLSAQLSSLFPCEDRMRSHQDTHIMLLTEAHALLAMLMHALFS